MPLKLLIDADMFCFRACASCEHEVDWGHDIWTLHVNLNEAKAHFEEIVENAIDDALIAYGLDGKFEVIFCFSNTNNFRKKILPTYKANRANKRKPVGYSALVSWVKDTYKWEQREWLEADDCIGILATLPENVDKCVIISGDKDMKCIYGYHYDFIRKEFYYVNKEEAMRHFFLQTLMGDSTDGYSGCPKIGKVKAQNILDKECSWDAVKKAYEKAGLSEDVALEQARVAKILISSDYDQKNGKVILWKPTEQK